jgi:flavin reductase (DIM6/NTAB) family NADH-FMN oxidoreductase RutF
MNTTNDIGADVAPPLPDPLMFRRVLGRFASGVTVVTTELGGTISGMTANAFMSGSLDPPLVVISVGRRARIREVLHTSRTFGISILRATQEKHSRHFSGQGALPASPRFTRQARIPVLADALATIASHIEAIHPCGDHELFVGRVLHLACRDGEPLLYFRGDYVGRDAEWTIAQHESWA